MKVNPKFVGALPSTEDVTKKSSVAGSKKEEKDWSVLLYLDGNNDIEGDILNSFLTLEEVSDLERMKILAQLGRAPQHIAHPSYQDEIDGDWDGVRRYEVDKGRPSPYPREVWTSLGTHDGKIDSKLVKDLGKADMSDPQTLKDFLSWGLKKYPAKHYMVVLADHGAGFLGSLSDYKSGKHMDLKDIAESFKKAEEETGVKPDILLMDACLMAEVEAAYELKDVAKYYIASEDVNWDCFPLQKTFKEAEKKWEKSNTLSPETMKDLVVKKAGEYTHIPTVSAIDAEKLEEFTQKMEKFSKNLLLTDTDKEIIRDIIKNTRNFYPENENVKPYSDYRDLGDFSKRIFEDLRIKDEELKSSAKEVFDFIKKELVKGEQHKEKYDDDDRRVWGVSIYLPLNGFDYSKGDYIFPNHTNKSQYEDIYRNLSFVKKTRWDKVIDRFSNPRKMRGEDVLSQLIKRGKELK